MVLPARVVSTRSTPAELVPWLVTVEGKDGTIVANHKNAVYKPASPQRARSLRGFRTVSGKKLWLWGTEQDAWVKSELIHNFPSYVELQGGLLQNHDMFQFLQPEQSALFSEFWIPVHDLGGVTRVIRHAILNLQRRADPSRRPLGAN